MSRGWFLSRLCPLFLAALASTVLPACTQSVNPTGLGAGISKVEPTTATAPTGESHAASMPPSPLMAVSVVRSCTSGSIQDLPVGSNNVVAGPVAFPNAKLMGSPAGLSAFYGGGQVPDGPDGSKFYKMGTLVKAGATATITVASSAQTYLKLQQGSGTSSQGLSRVVFQACPGSSYTGWVGGFDIKGQLPLCVALDIQVAGEPALRHLSIAFGGIACG